MKAGLLLQDFTPTQRRMGVAQHQPATCQCSDELNRVLSAAVVNKNFCRRLLAAPLATIAEGYCGYVFDLPEREANILGAIRSVSLDDFARQIIDGLTDGQTEVDQTDVVRSGSADLDYSMVPVAQMNGEVAILFA